MGVVECCLERVAGRVALVGIASVEKFQIFEVNSFVKTYSFQNIHEKKNKREK